MSESKEMTEQRDFSGKANITVTGTVLDMPESKETPELVDWRAKQPWVVSRKI